MGGASGDVRELRTEVQVGRQIHFTNAGRGAGRTVLVTVVGDRDARDRYDGVGFVDHDFDRAAGVVVVAGHVSERPVGGAAGGIHEGRAKIETFEVLSFDALRGSRRAVRLAIVDAGVTLHVDDRVRLVDDDRNRAALVVVVGAAREGPVGGAARGVRELRPKVEVGGQVNAAHAGRGAGRTVFFAVVGQRDTGNRHEGFGLVDGDRNGAVCGRVVGITGEAPVSRAAWEIDKRVPEVQKGGEVLTQNAGG